MTTLNTRMLRKLLDRTRFRCMARATVFDFDTVYGTISMVDCFQVVEGKILSIRVYYDPRPILEGMSKAAPPAP